MDTKQTNRVTMFKTVTAFLDENNSVWTAMAPLAAAVQLLKDKIIAIDDTAQKQETPTTGAAVDKSTARDALEDVLFLTCEALGVLGTTNADNELVALTTLTPSTLHTLRDEELVNRATNVLDKANTRTTDLATLQVTAANITELSEALEDFKATKAKPRTVVAGRAAETETLPGLIRDASEILRNQIDRMVNLFRRSHPKFVSGYRSARVTVDRAATRTTSKPAPAPPTPTP